MPKVLIKFQGGHPNRGNKYWWVDDNGQFSTNIWLYLRSGAR